MSDGRPSGSSNAAQPTSPSKSGNDEQQRLLRRSSSAGSAPPKTGKQIVDWYLRYAGCPDYHSPSSKSAVTDVLLTFSLFGALSTMGTLGAGFTLSVVVLSPPDPDNMGYKRFSPHSIDRFGAISSVLFVLTVLVSQGCAQLFRFEQGSIADGLDDDEWFITWGLAALSLLLQVQVLGAFVFLQLVLTAYQPVVGWIGIALTSALGMVALGLWLLQATGRRPIAK